MTGSYMLALFAAFVADNIIYHQVDKDLKSYYPLALLANTIIFMLWYYTR